MLGPLVKQDRKERAAAIERDRQAALRWQRQSVEIDSKHNSEIEALKKAVPTMIGEGMSRLASFRQRTNAIAEECKLLEQENELLYGRQISSTDMLTIFSQGNYAISGRCAGSIYLQLLRLFGIKRSEMIHYSSLTSLLGCCAVPKRRQQTQQWMQLNYFARILKGKMPCYNYGCMFIRFI